MMRCAYSVLNQRFQIRLPELAGERQRVGEHCQRRFGVPLSQCEPAKAKPCVDGGGGVAAAIAARYAAAAVCASPACSARWPASSWSSRSVGG
jgi:hypothetical protein